MSNEPSIVNRVPPGIYKAKITEDVRVSGYAKFSFQIAGGRHDGASISSRFRVDCEKGITKVQAIARALRIGLHHPKDFEEGMLAIRVKESPTGVNQIVAYLEVEAADVLAEPQTVDPAIERLGLFDSETLLATDFRQRFLIDRVLVAGQPGVAGGPKKGMKTSILVDAAVSLKSATKFLGVFDVPAQTNVLMLSGESGGHTLREIATRVCDARKIKLVDPAHSEIVWGFKLPKLADPADLEVVEDAIVRRKIGAVFVDPAYLCLLSGDAKGRQASNVFDMGSILQGVSEIGARTGATILLAHHSRMHPNNPFAPPELEDLSYAGFGEWARQWVLLSRRKKYDKSGHHELWMQAGGSAGHSGEWAIDIDEGTVDEHFRGRYWNVAVCTAAELAERKEDDREERKDVREAIKVEKHRRKILDAMKAKPDGRSETAIRDSAGLNAKDFNKAFATIPAAMLEAVEVRGRNKQKYDGWKLSEIGQQMAGCASLTGIPFVDSEIIGTSGTHKDCPDSSVSLPQEAHTPGPVLN